MLDIINKIRHILGRKDKLALSGVALLMTLSSLLEMAGIGVLVALVTLILVPDTSFQGEFLTRAAEFFKEMISVHGKYRMLAAISLLFVLKALFSYFIVKISAVFIYAKQREFAIRMYENFLRGDYQKLTSRPVGELEVNLHYCSLLSPYILMPLAQFIGDCLTIFLLGAALAAAMPLITFGGILFMALAGAAIQLASARMNRIEGEKFSRAETANAIIRLAGLNNVAYIKSVLAEAFFVDLYRQSELESNKSASRIFTLGQIPRFSLECAATLLMLAIFAAMLCAEVPAAQILATFTAIVAVMARILPALSRSHYNLMRIKQSKPIFDRIYHDLCGFPQEKSGNSEITPTLKSKLVIENVSYLHPGASEPTPKPFSLEIPAFSSCGIAGKTGCGKSTLIEMLLGLRTPATGTIRADGTDIFSNVRAWRSGTGYVPQVINLIPGTLRENVAFGVPADQIDDKKVKEALELAQLTEFELDRQISADGNNLSGGQKQRIGIARALYREVKLLILDEATSNLDTDTEEAFVSALDNLRGKLTLIVIAHRQNTIEKCDQIINLSDAG